MTDGDREIKFFHLISRSYENNMHANFCLVTLLLLSQFWTER